MSDPADEPRSTEPPALDILGDVHGHLAALVGLGRDLGYAVEQDWSHPEGRLLLFVGDLVDRGPASLEVCELVRSLVLSGRALCLMGNHEYNLVGWHLGTEKGRPGNRQVREDVLARPDRWAPVLDWMATLPVAASWPGLRVIHAVWHSACVARVLPVLGAAASAAAPWCAPETGADRAAESGDGWAAGPAAGADSTADAGASHASRRAGVEPPRLTRPTPGSALDRLWAGVTLASPFERGALRPSLPNVGCPPSPDADHEVLFKGFEEQADEPFLDADGNRRDLVRVCWWQDAHAAVPDDGLTVFGHYWCLPPRSPSDPFAPPYPTGHPQLIAWEERHMRDVALRGRCPVPEQVAFVCVDYNGVLRHRDTGCVGALRWPEREVAWRREA